MSDIQADGKNREQKNQVCPPGARNAPLRGSAAPGGPGLDSSSISRQHGNYSRLTGTITINQNGLKATRNEIPPLFTRQKYKFHIQKYGGRKEIKGFSKDSRRRSIDFLGKIDWNILKGSSKKARNARGIFLTLTYPNGYATNWQSWKRDLDNFRKHLLRTYPETAVLWKLENQESRCKKTGADFAPHFHLLIDLRRTESLRRFRKWVSLVWFHVVGSNDTNHLKRGAYPVPLYGESSKIIAYFTKYLTKTFQTKTKTGRVWGVWNKFELTPSRTVTASWVDITRLTRNYGGRYSKYLGRINARTTLGFRMPGENLEQLLRGLKHEQKP